VAPAEYRGLDACGAGEALTVMRVSDRDPAKLRALEDLGLRLGARVEVVSESRFEGPIEVRVDRRRRQVPLGLARVVFLA
jgi:DtxR family Mn-dependent transcriptional regulator